MGNIFERIEGLFKERYKGWDGAEQFNGSGDRLRRLIDEMCWPIPEIDAKVKECFEAIFPDPYEEILVCKDISVWTLCPHHILPCNFRVFIGYVPRGKVLGLSKFARVAITLAKKPIMQEQYTRELADVFEENLTPIGLGVYVIGKHGCIGCRGVNQEIDIVTSDLRGCFLNDRTREEFYSICK